VHWIRELLQRLQEVRANCKTRNQLSGIMRWGDPNVELPVQKEGTAIQQAERRANEVLSHVPSCGSISWPSRPNGSVATLLSGSNRQRWRTSLTRSARCGRGAAPWRVPKPQPSAGAGSSSALWACVMVWEPGWRCQLHHADRIWRPQKGESGTTSDACCPSTSCLSSQAAARVLS
jgi:hypothetical protein